VLVEALVLGGEDGVHQRTWHILEAHHGTALLAELADQLAVLGEDA